MKNLFLPLYCTLFIFCSAPIFSQSSESNEIINTSTSVTSFDKRDKKLVGSSYIDEKFSLAKLSNSDKLYSVRYNTYQEEMELEKDGKPYYLPKSSDYTITFTASNKTYKVYSFNYKNENKKGYFVKLFKGEKFDLLLKERIKFTEEVKPNTGYDKYKPPTLKRAKDKMYIGYPNNTATVLPSKKKEVLALFSGKSKDVEKFAKSNKLGFSKKDDLIKIFEYYNSL